MTVAQIKRTDKWSSTNIDWTVLVATLQQARGDKKFAYGKRPTQAVNLTHEDDVEEDCPQMRTMTPAQKRKHWHDGHGCEVRA